MGPKTRHGFLLTKQHAENSAAQWCHLHRLQQSIFDLLTSGALTQNRTTSPPTYRSLFKRKTTQKHILKQTNTKFTHETWCLKDHWLQLNSLYFWGCHCFRCLRSFLRGVDSRMDEITNGQLNTTHVEKREGWKLMDKILERVRSRSQVFEPSTLRVCNNQQTWDIFLFTQLQNFDSSNRWKPTKNGWLDLYFIHMHDIYCIII